MSKFRTWCSLMGNLLKSSDPLSPDPVAVPHPPGGLHGAPAAGATGACRGGGPSR